MRYLIAVRSRPEAPSAPPPGPAWRCAYAGDRTTIWGLGDVPGAPLANGYCLGATSRPIHDSTELAAAWGGYVAVHETGRDVTVARDPTGRVPAYWLPGREGHLVGSHVEDLGPYLREPLEIDWALITALLLRNYMPARRTGFRQLAEILPGETLVLSEGEASRRLHWSPGRFWSAPYGDVGAAKAGLRRAAEESVAFWACRYSRILMDLSGGLDSSAVLGLLARLDDPPEIVGLNAVVGHEESDERPFARAAAAMAGIALHEVDLSEAIPVYDGPAPGPLQPRPTPQLRGTGLDIPGLRLAREVGAEAYFTGRGGDHLFYNSLPALAARDRLVAGWRLAGFPAVAMQVARATRRSLAEVLAEALSPPRAARDVLGLVLGANPFVTLEAARAIDPEAFLHPWAAEAADSAPLGKIRQVCFLIELQRHYDRIGRAAVMDEVNPLISQPLLEASLRTPSYMFAFGGRQRGLQREVFGDVLPQIILNRRTKGATTSHSIRTLVRNLPYLRERLLDGELVREGLLDRDLLEARLTPTALLDGRFRPGLGECVSAQLWLGQARTVMGRYGLHGAGSEDDP